MATAKTGSETQYPLGGGSGLVLVDFWASWCDVCQASSLLVEELAEQYKGQLKTVKIDVDDHPVVAARYHVHALPTLALLENGRLIDQFSGFTSKDKVQEAIEWVLERAKKAPSRPSASEAGG
jgi:thioredoxin